MLSSNVFVSITILLFVYAILSLITNQIVGYIQDLFSWRALILEHGIKNMLGDISLTNKLYENPFVKT
jgi:hypothetical protein